MSKERKRIIKIANVPAYAHLPPSKIVPKLADDSGINFVTPEQHHRGQDEQILAKRKQVYKWAKSEHPERWSGSIRNWDSVKAVFLNPENISRRKMVAGWHNFYVFCDNSLEIYR